MKKFAKGCLITAFSMLCIGVIILVEAGKAGKWILPRTPKRNTVLLTP